VASTNHRLRNRLVVVSVIETTPSSCTAKP
jgi:hypothetical protein